MKSLKKTLVLLVVLSMILTTLAPAFAAATDVAGMDCEEEVARMEALGIITGFEDGTFRPNETITRAQMAVIICKMVGVEEAIVEGSKNVESKFSDVKAGEWYSGYVNVAAGRGIISGFPDGTFRPNETLTMHQVITLCVNALGRGNHVSTMGTWPANYISEAAKLGLIDDVESSDANRGNVAIIAWNTLEAPYVWDVGETVFQGDISLNNSGRSLLSYHFRDYVYGDTNILKEAEYATVSVVPSLDKELGDRQIVLSLTDKFAKAFLDAFDSEAPRKNADEATYVKAGGYTTNNDVTTWAPVSIYAYVPGEADLESLYGKTVTVIFGEDNHVVSIRNIDETIEDEYLTAYEDSKVYVGGTGYKFVTTDGKVFVNNKEITAMNDVDNTEEAMAKVAEILDIEDITDIEKVIEANIVFDAKGTKIARLDLFVSGNYPEINTYEGIVLKVSKDVIYLSNGDKIDYKDLEEDELPKVYKNGSIIEIDEIVAGDTLTYYADTAALNADLADTIYVSSNTVAGKVATVRKANLAVKVEEGTYAPSDVEPKMTTKELSKSSGAWENVTSSSLVKNDEVTMYINIYGEYAGITLEKEISNWQFGVATFVSDNIGTEGEDEEIATRRVRILLPDGSKTYFTVTVDTDEENRDESDLDYLENAEKKLVAFSQDGNKKIDIEDFYILASVTDQDSLDAVANKFGTELKDTLENEYVLTFVDEGVEALNGKRINVVDGMRYSSSTTLYNLGNKQNAEIEVVGDWESVLMNGNSKKFGSAAIIVTEDGEDIPTCIALDLAAYATSDSMYAVVDVDAHETEDDEYVKLFVGGAESEEIELKKDLAESVLDQLFKKAFIGYKTASNKIEAATALVDVKNFNRADEEDVIGGTGFIYETKADETQLAVAISGDNYSTKVTGKTVKEDVTFADVWGTSAAALGDYYVLHVEDIIPARDNLDIYINSATHANIFGGTCDETTGFVDPKDGWATAYKTGANSNKYLLKADKNILTGLNTEDDADDMTLLVKADAATEAERTFKFVFEYKDANNKDVVEYRTLVVDIPATPQAPADNAQYAETIVELVNTTKVAYKANFEVDDVVLDKDDADIKFVEIEDEAANQIEKLGTVIVERDELTIYDLRNGILETMTVTELDELVEADEEPVYVIPFLNSDCDTAKGYDANILVVL